MACSGTSFDFGESGFTVGRTDVVPFVWTAFELLISGNAARSRRGGGNVEIVF